MALRELGSASALQDFIENAGNQSSLTSVSGLVVVTFSAHWCGPCRQSKPALQEIANKYSGKVPMGIVYEDTIPDAIHQYEIRAFPTHVVFLSGKPLQRHEGANVDAVDKMIQTAVIVAAAKGAGQKVFSGSGETIGGKAAANAQPKTAEELRLLRLQTLSGSVGAGAGAGAGAGLTAGTGAEVGAEKEVVVKSEDVEMTDADGSATVEAAESANADIEPSTNAMETLTQDMGFSEIRARKGLKFGGGTLEGAINWLMQHQDDENIDDPMDLSLDTEADQVNSTTGESTNADGSIKAMSYKCNDCGKILSNMANLELHANKTGHSDFEESTTLVKPLTAEEKAAKIAEIKDLLKAKRSEREEQEKVEHTEREKQRRFMGKEMLKTKEQMEQEARKREVMLRKKEKEAFKKERARLREEIAKDKAERLANQGKLSSKLGVEGYNPDGIQYDVPADNVASPDALMAEVTHVAKKKTKADPTRIDEYIKKVSSYKAGGDGGKCLKVLKAYVGNAAAHPDEEKYRTINMDNNAFKTKVKPFIGAKSLLLAVGFAEVESGDALVLTDEPDMQLLMDTKTKLEVALSAYG